MKSIVGSLIDNMDKFQDWDNPMYSNIQSFKRLKSTIESIPCRVRTIR